MIDNPIPDEAGDLDYYQFRKDWISLYQQLESLARTDKDTDNLSQWRDYFMQQREQLLNQTDE